MPCPPPCPCCCQGQPGADGKSAYQIALDHGFVGTEAEWLASLKGEPGEPAPFLSSYVEALGSTQRVDSEGKVFFDTDPDALDVVGKDIELDATGSAFIIKRAGLYHVEWSMNLALPNDNALVGLTENGEPASALASMTAPGSYSSGALLHVKESDVPYTVSLYNFGAPIAIENFPMALNTAVSLRILRFADGPGE